MSITVRSALKYSLLPGILPRARDIFASGFIYIPYFMALVYRSVGLLPANHPYLRPENRRRYGITHVIAEAAQNMRFNFQYIDKIIVFFALLIGAVVMFLQLIATAAALFIQAANAAMPVSFAEFFVTDPPTHDIAFVLLERIFGVPGGSTTGFFNTCVSLDIICFENMVTADGSAVTDISLYPNGSFPSTFHTALQAIMQYYSIALLVVAMLIFTYFMFAVFAETAETGTPFGRRFNKIFAPLRMVLAFALLIPVANGFNSAQYLTLYMAKWGSSFATNGWKVVNASLATSGSTLLGDPATLVSYPKIPPTNSLVEFASAMATCVVTSYRNTYDDPANGKYKKVIDAYIVKKGDGAGPPASANILLKNSTYEDALEFSGFQDIVIRFGHYQLDSGGKPIYGKEQGYVEPTCGELILPTTSIDQEAAPGTWLMQTQYYYAVMLMWEESGYLNDPNTPQATPSVTSGTEKASGLPCQDIMGFPDPASAGKWRFCDVALAMANLHLESTPDPNSQQPDQIAAEDMLEFYDLVFNSVFPQSSCGTACTLSGLPGIIPEAVFQQSQSNSWSQDLTQLGWAGAGIWYNKVAQLNGSLFNAVYNLPIAHLYPKIMEEMKQRNIEENQVVDYWEQFKPYIADEASADTTESKDYREATVLYNAQSFWQPVYPEAEGNAIKDFIVAIFGLEGLYAMTENKANNIHPLAMLAGVGKSLVESSVRNLGFSAAAYAVGGIAHIAGMQGTGTIAITIGGILSSIGMIGLAVGFVLFYIVPLMPFIYFFFAVAGWVKGIFEAMVGVPLWALAHIRIDGEGLPGDAAMNGYYLLFEIFLRPFLIIVGLIAALQIFAAQVFVLHEIWEMVVNNVAGKNLDPANVQNLQGKVNTFFYTVLYAIVVYMLGMACFKLIDLIPNHILRWIGASVMTFGEGAGDPAGHLVRNTMFGTQHIGSKLTGAMESVGTAGQEIRAGINKIKAAQKQ